MSLPPLVLKKNEDTRLRHGHVWVYSNEVDIKKTPLKDFTPGQEVLVHSSKGEPLGVAYINPHSLIAARLFSKNPETRLTRDWLSQKLNQALNLRESLFPNEPYYRLAFSESDELPGLVIDRFGDHLAAQCNTYGMENKKEEILAALRELLPDMKSLLWRNDSSIRKQEGLDSYISTAFGTPPETVELRENQVRFSLPFLQGQKTGWFYDHRLNRNRLKAYSPDQSVLDVFSYLGGWGIQAAVAGAKSVTCIDSSALACEGVLQNAKLNQVENKLEVICEEALPALQKLAKEKKTFDIVVLDPPAFIKRRKDHKEGLIAYQRFNTLALKLLKPQGILVSGSCSMHLSEEELHHVLERAAREAKTSLQLLERGHQGPDHPVHLAIPETNYLKANFLRRLEGT